jgi:hypothetical protein
MWYPTVPGSTIRLVSGVHEGVGLFLEAIDGCCCVTFIWSGEYCHVASHGICLYYIVYTFSFVAVHHDF